MRIKTKNILKEIQTTSFCSVDPLKFVESKRSEFILKLTIHLGCSDEEASRHYNFLPEILIRLREMRYNEVNTCKFLEKSLNPFNYALKFFMITCLLKAITSEYTYCRSFHFLAHMVNPDLAFPIIPLPITDHDLMALLNNEKPSPDPNPFLKNNPYKTFKTFLSPAELNTVRLRLITQQKINKISEADFSYLFTEQSISSSMVRVYWNDSRCLCHDLLSSIVYKNSKFDYRQINSSIAFKEGKKLTSSFKSKSQYKNNDFLTQLLNF